MKTLFFSTHDFEKKYLDYWTEKLAINAVFLNSQLYPETVGLVKDCESISCWANDNLGKDVIKNLAASGVKFISLRSAGFSHLDLDEAKKQKIAVCRVPAYSPQAIAEHTLGLLMCLNRKLPRSFQRVKDFNFKLDGLEGITLYGKSVGIIGVGKIGEAFARIMHGMGCKLYFVDPYQNKELAKELNAQYVDLKTLLENSDVVSLLCPLNEQTKYIINEKTAQYLKKDAFLLNTGRGALMDTQAIINKLKRNELRGVGLDVYEHEEKIFAHDHSLAGISDEKLLRLMSFPNVLITSHQAFFTKEALDSIARISCENIFNYLHQQEIPKDNKVL
ncbi:MAG: 2-hydroxyacid dehydrogenase [Bacteriovoracaceae bacterium]|jgi:D-lactate dehydrogenase|nr:hydroxyacid dehydrogenase [Halobacteriovoraceae bacterium]MDP7320784.1 2-hydroxyacid dehydrogenase [Bacteriovoracaceae bacterium]